MKLSKEEKRAVPEGGFLGRRGVKTGIIGEEQGLMTLFVDATIVPAGLKTLPRAVRMRMNPPAKEQREDGHVYDLDAAFAFAERTVLAPLLAKHRTVKVADVVAGAGRFTLGLRFPITVDAKAVQKQLEASVIAPWTLESVEIVTDRAGKRERSLLERISFDFEQKPAACDGKVAALVGGLAKNDSFVKLAGLDGPKPKPARVDKAIRWLDKQLVVFAAALRAAPVRGFEQGQVRLVINCHDRFREVRFDFDAARSDSDPVHLPKTDAALRAWLDLPAATVRRVPGILWTSDRFDALSAARLKHVRIDLES